MRQSLIDKIKFSIYNKDSIGVKNFYNKYFEYIKSINKINKELEIEINVVNNLYTKHKIEFGEN